MFHVGVLAFQRAFGLEFCSHPIMIVFAFALPLALAIYIRISKHETFNFKARKEVLYKVHLLILLLRGLICRFINRRLAVGEYLYIVFSTCFHRLRLMSLQFNIHDESVFASGNTSF